MAVNYTKEQEEAMNYLSSSLLVSAGAGSGKTTVMIERVARLIKEKNVPIKRFLIISFTKASASDMKNKLIKKLSSLEPTPFLLEQIDDVLTSDVSNLHSYCARLLKAYFYEVGLDPTFVVLDDDEANLLKDKALERLFRDKSAAGDKEFYNLVDVFAKKRSLVGLKDAILRVYEFLCSIVDKDEFKNKTLNELYNENLDENSAAKILNGHMISEFYRLKDLLKINIDYFNSVGEEKLVAYLNEVDSAVNHINPKSSFFENASRLNLIKRMPNIPSLPVEKAELCLRAKAVKEEVIGRIGKLKTYCLCDDLENISVKLGSAKKVLESLFNLTDEFEKYFDLLKKEKGGLDFNDLEKYTLKVLKNPSILNEIKDKYDYILVDEYQDINSVQDEIIRLVSKGDNLFMVGDVKQSIYRFRLCDPEIFLKKYNLFGMENGAGHLVKLNSNFRSFNGILDFVNAVFSETMTVDFGGVDYKSDALLKSGNEKAVDNNTRVGILFCDGEKTQKEDKPLEVYSVMNDNRGALDVDKQATEEGLMIASEIASLMQNAKILDRDSGKYRNVRYSDITILTSSRSAFLAKIVKTLEKLDIPVSTDIEGNCLEDEFVYGVKCFLMLLANFNDDNTLFSCMFSSVFNFTADELSEIKIAGKQKYFYKNVLLARNLSLKPSTQDKLSHFFELYEEAREKAKYLPVEELAKFIVKKQNLYVKLSFGSKQDKKKQKLNKFLSSLGSESVFEYVLNNADFVKCDAESQNNSVKVMTIHKSKGLEFGIVFLVSACKNFNFDDMKKDMLISKDIGIALNYYDTVLRYKNDTIAKKAIKLVETRKLLEEQQRLLYVALTRATDYLFVVGSGKLEDIKGSFPTSPTCFMDFIGHLVKHEEDYKNIYYFVKIYDEEDLLKNKIEDENSQVLINGDPLVAKTIKESLNKPYKYQSSTTVPVKTAVTKLADSEEENNYIWFSEDDEVSSAQLGTLQHKFMENCTLSENYDELILKAQSLVDNGTITKEEKDMIMFDGISKLLQSPEFQNIIKGAEKIFKEREFFMAVDAKKYFGGCEGDKVVVQGVVDLCLFLKDGIVIVDYKSGRVDGSNKEKYTNQINLYAEAMEKCFYKPVIKKYIASLKNGNMIEV